MEPDVAAAGITNVPVVPAAALGKLKPRQHALSTVSRPGISTHGEDLHAGDGTFTISGETNSKLCGRGGCSL